MKLNSIKILWSLDVGVQTDFSLKAVSLKVLLLNAEYSMKKLDYYSKAILA